MPEARDVRRRLRYRLLERVVAWSLYWMALLAHRDGDRHELHHIVLFAPPREIREQRQREYIVKLERELGITGEGEHA